MSFSPTSTVRAPLLPRHNQNTPLQPPPSYYESGASVYGSINGGNEEISSVPETRDELIDKVKKIMAERHEEVIQSTDSTDYFGPATLQGVPHGVSGLKCYAYGDKGVPVQFYLGDWVDGVREGENGTYVTPTETFVGKWRDDKKIEGTTTYADGSSFKGTYKGEGERDVGLLTISDGKKFDGTWQGNEFLSGLETKPNGMQVHWDDGQAESSDCCIIL